MEPEEPARRYEHDNPGGMIASTSRGPSASTGPGTAPPAPGPATAKGPAGSAPTSASTTPRASPAGLFPNERQESAVECLATSVAYYKRLGVTVRRVMTDNGPCYTSRVFAAACRRFGVRHVRTKPYTPKTNGKAERFIQTALRERDCARTYETSEQRAADFPAWMHMYNRHRPHAALGSRPPISRLRMDQGNLLMHHSYRYPRGVRMGTRNAGRCWCLRTAVILRQTKKWYIDTALVDPSLSAIHPRPGLASLSY